MNYSELAFVYDQLADDYDYTAWADFYRTAFERWGKMGKLRILDAACGTGNMTLALAALGHDVVGVDVSNEMLQIAAAKLRAHGYKVPLARMDIRELRLHRPVDAVVCACDGVNYLTSLEDVSRFFAGAAELLTAGGLLVFDISTPYKLERMQDTLYSEEREDVVYIWRNCFDEKSRRLHMDVTLFVREGRLFRRAEELHVQRAHREEELEPLLEGSGFRVLAKSGGFDFERPAAQDLRLHIICEKI
ncbi:MAG: class I SAM-dependent DNA methyltransferase [Christensenellales bacterium]|jgi:2-polyprenyl-3-methyl-5-hydroxy-6-metoxy-1,4-benzoquinol methylase